MSMGTDGVLSVIVPVYNAIESVGKCLDSILAQTYQNMEILVIDDGSTDGSEEICDEYSRKDHRVKAIHISNGGPARARNTGLKTMSGRYLTFVDADDYIDPGLYEAIISELQKEQAAMLISGWFHHDIVHRKTSRIINKNPRKITPGQLQHRVLEAAESCGGGYPWNKLLDCSSIGSMVFFDESLSIYEDLVWLLGITNSLKPGSRIKLSAYYGYHYMDRPDSLSHSWSLPQYRSMILAWDKISGMTDLHGKAKIRHDHEILDAIWGICKKKGKAGDFYKKHRPLFQLRRNMPDIRRSIKAVLVKIYCKFYN